MSRKGKVDESGDSEGLQALFDEIASGNTAQSTEPLIRQVTIEPSDEESDGDSDELQDLFDSIADASAPAQHEPRPVAAVGEQAATDNPDGNVEVFERIGMLTRQIHEALRELVGDDVLRYAKEAMPDARHRLQYVVQMSEQSASRVLNATDVARPLQDRMKHDSENLIQQWDKVFANQLSVEEFRALAHETRGFLGQVHADSDTSSAQLMEIMMAQDFQDLTGQVIKRVIEVAQTVETELLSLLLSVVPPERRAVARDNGLMNGPVVDSRGREDVVTSQEQVDDLLDSLGF